MDLQQAMAEITRLQALIQTKRPQPILPDPEQYDGEEMNAYPQAQAVITGRRRDSHPGGKEVVFENYCQQLGVIADQLEELAPTFMLYPTLTSMI
jgi:hypothetical protein